MLWIILAARTAGAVELAGFLSADGRFFPNGPLHKGQAGNDASITLEPELYHEWNRLSLTFKPFLRINSADDERSHSDVREFMFLWYNDDWELRIGTGKVFWGVTESQHLVDIINQTDAIEAIDGEAKLGQPMAHLSVIADFGVFELYILPYFRQRTFPGEKGRLRAPEVVDTSNARYESSRENRHVDAALRYSHTIDAWEIGLSYFYGTTRDPSLLQESDNNETPVLIPFYEIINQSGLELQLVADAWLWKLETIYRSGQGEEDFYALTGGFEYTFTGMTPGGADIGALAEWLYDERGENAGTPFYNNILLGARIAFNDAAGTEALMGIIRHLELRSANFTLESSRRLNDNWKIAIEALLIHDRSEGFMNSLRKDSYVQLEIFYYLP